MEQNQQNSIEDVQSLIQRVAMGFQPTDLHLIIQPDEAQSGFDGEGPDIACVEAFAGSIENLVMALNHSYFTLEQMKKGSRLNSVFIVREDINHVLVAQILLEIPEAGGVMHAAGLDSFATKLVHMQAVLRAKSCTNALGPIYEPKLLVQHFFSSDYLVINYLISDKSLEFKQAA